MFAVFCDHINKHRASFRTNRILMCCLILLISVCIANADDHDCKIDDWRKVDIIKILSHGSLDFICYNYNDYGDNVDTPDPDNPDELLYPTGKGHGGWDVDFTQNDRHPFYSITRGEVMAAGVGPNKVIAVYDKINNLMTLYLHASHVHVEKGDFVDFGKHLGNQGNQSHQSIGYHVHIEVRKLTSEQTKLSFEEQIQELIKPSIGKDHSVRPTIDPIPYLYEFTKWHKAEQKRKQSILWPRLKKDW